jgi:hypothetical protein
VHRLNCVRFFKITVFEVTDDQRQDIKKVVFGVIYGKGAASLAIELKKDEDGAVALDKQGRIKYILVPHDIAILRFKEELENYGFDSSEEDVVKELMGIYKKFKEKQKERRK